MNNYPWDFFDKSGAEIPESTIDERISICRSCEHLIPSLDLCKISKLFMKNKTLLKYSSCPLDKWGEYVE